MSTQKVDHLKVLFVYSDVSGEERYGGRKFYSGIGSLSAVLKAAGHQTSLLYLQREWALPEFLDAVQDAAPGLVGFSATTHQYPYIERYARALRAARPDLTLVCGGTHPTLVPDDVLQSAAFDAVCVGEGEYALRDLVERLQRGEDYADVANLWVRRGEQLHRNTMRPLIDDLDELPLVDRELFDYDALLAANSGWVDIMSGRGCPYDCSYCCNPALKRCFHGLGRYVRFRSVSHVMGELRSLRARFPVKTVNFQDDTFTLNRDWVLEFCRAYGAEFEYPFWVNTRVERILDEELVAALAHAHCAGVRVGVENGDPALRAGVLKRNTSNQDIIAAADLLHRNGLKLYTCNMIGIPGETPASIGETVDLNRRLMPDEFQFSVFYPYPMTELHGRCVENGLLKPESRLSNYYSRESVLSQPQLSAEELSLGYARFEALRSELVIRRKSVLASRLYSMLLGLYGGDGVRLQRHIDRLRRLWHRLKGQHATQQRGYSP